MLIKPTYSIDGDVTEIDLDALFESGLRGLIFDLDSTLMESKTGIVTAEVSEWLGRARPRFKMIVLSNNKRLDYLDDVSVVLDMKVIGHAAKPFRSGFAQALGELKLPPAEVAIIGDRPLTDILGGQFSGLSTVLVRPLKTIRDPAWKSFLRNVERSLIRF